MRDTGAMTAGGLPRVGLIGLGRMGQPMARNLLRAGYPLVVQSRSRGPIDALVAEGALAAERPAHVARRADIVLTALPTEAACRDVFLGADGLVAHATPGTLLIDISTVSPDVSREVYAAAAARGVSFLDAPVSGGPEGAAEGTLTIMAGGDAAAFQRALPLLHVLGSNVRHVGPSGAGSVVKLVNQVMTALNGVAVAEALAFGNRFAVDPAVLGEVIGSSFGDSRMFRRLLPMIAARDFSGGAAIELYVKDIGIVAELGHAAGLHLPLTDAALAALLEARAAGMGANDIGAMVTRSESASES